MAASRYITEGFFFPKSLSREREMKVFFSPLLWRRGGRGAAHSTDVWMKARQAAVQDSL